MRFLSITMKTVSLGLLSAMLACGGSIDNRLTPLPTPPAHFDLTATGALPAGSAAFGAALHRGDFATASVNGIGNAALNGLVAFNPSTGFAAAPIALPVHIDFRAYNSGAGLTRSDGTAALDAPGTFPGGAVQVGGRLFVALNNLNTSTYAFEPAVVLVYAVRGLSLVLEDTIVLGSFVGTTGTAHYNASVIVPFTHPVSHASRLAVVCGDDAFGAAPHAAVVVINPALRAIEHVVALGATAASTGRVALTRDAKLYIGSSIDAEVYEVDLAATPPIATRNRTNPLRVTTDADLNQIPVVALSHHERYLYVLNSNDSSLTVLDRTNGFAEVARKTEFRRSKQDRTLVSGSPFESQAYSLAVLPGTTTMGPRLVIATILIDDADRVLTDVKTALDTVPLDADGLPTAVSLDHVVAPFTPNTDLQDIAVSPVVPGYVFALEGATGRMHAISIVDLR